jgi:hypothetical protein
VITNDGKVPLPAEPFMQNANASVELLPVMSQDDSRAAMTKPG